MDDISYSFYVIYASSHCKESIATLMYGMTLSEYLDYRNFIDMQNAFDKAIEIDSNKPDKK